MTEPQRTRAIEAVQLQLFEIRQSQYKLKLYRLRLVRKLKRIKLQGVKICRKVDCRKEKPVSEFYRDERYADGYHPWCKRCKRRMVNTRWKEKQAA